MKQVQSVMHQWIKGLMTSASMFVFSVSIASDDITTASNTGTPYSYTNPDSASAPSYNDVGRPVDEEANSIAINNQLLGLSGPIQISGTYSANYGSGVQAQFSHMLGFDDAIGLLGAYASEENRIDITWAHAWSDKQRTKVSVERLEQKMDFDYDSGAVSTWVPQYAYGAAYQYIFNKNWLKNVELSGYYANAQSQDLSTIRFIGSDNQWYDNYRHIAGATSKGSEATITVSPWKTGMLGLGLNYDNVHYNTKYDNTDAENASGLGFTLSLEQLLSKHIKINLEGSQREVYDDYTAGVSFLTPSNLEIGLHGERTIGQNGSASDSQLNVNLAYFFDDKNRYDNGYSLVDVSPTDLAKWASTSVAYMDEVLAAADQETVLVSSNSQANTDADQTANVVDQTPVLNLTVGEVNHISIADYVAKLHLTDAQKQATPTIEGGPTGVEFTYDNQTESLVTTTEVPKSAITAAAKPLLVLFPQDDSASKKAAHVTTGSLHNESQETLTFKIVIVTGNTTAPVLNSSANGSEIPFNGSIKPVTTHANTWVFKYENIANPSVAADASTMFLNSNATYPSLTLTSKTGTNLIGTHNCYTVSAQNSASTQTLTITSIASNVCPDSGTYGAIVSNGMLVSPTQTITFTAQPAQAPFVAGAAITSPMMVGGQNYPGYAFPTTGETNVVSPGEGESFDTTTPGANTLTVYNAATCAPIVDSNLKLDVTSSQVTLGSSGPIPTKYLGTTFALYLSVTNSAGETGTNGTSCIISDANAFTAKVYGAPVIPNDINLGTATVDTSYSYNFVAQGGVTTGSSGLNTSASNCVYTVDGATVTDTNLSCVPTSTEVTLSGLVNSKYADKTIDVFLNLTNTDGYSASTDPQHPAVLQVLANSSEAPSVGGASAVADANEGKTYSGYTFADITPGASRSYANVNTVSDEGTYVKVADASGQDVTNLAHLTLSASGNALSLESNGAAVDASLIGSYNVYVHVANDANATATNCSDATCSTLTGGKPYTLFVNNPPTISPDINLGETVTGNAYSYDFVQSGTLKIGSTNLNTDANVSKVTMKLSDKSTEVTPDRLGLTPVVSATDVVLSGAVNPEYAGQTIYVYLDLTDTAGFTVTNDSNPAYLKIAANSSVTGYVYCPSSDYMFTHSGSIQATVYDAPSNGNAIGVLSFTTALNTTAQVQLYGAYINDGKLTCLYAPRGTNTQYTEVIQAPIPRDATLSPGEAGGQLDGHNGCTPANGTDAQPSDADSSCQVQYTYTGA